MQRILERVAVKLCSAGGRALRARLCGSWTKAGPSKQCSLISLSGLLTQTAGAKQRLSPCPLTGEADIPVHCVRIKTGWWDRMEKKTRKMENQRLNNRKIWTVSLYKEGHNLCRGKTVRSVCLSHNIILFPWQQ